MIMRFLSLTICALLLSSCLKDKPPVVQTIVAPSGSNKGGVFIINEGGFNYGNSGISYYRIDDGAVSEDLFKPANNRKLGDVCQSMTLFNGEYFLVVNNSEKIEVVDHMTFKSKATIGGMLSPRYFLGVSPEKAYVSDYKSGRISILDLNSYTVSGTIDCPGWTEGMALSYGKAFVTNLRSKYVYVVNTLTDQITDSIEVGHANGSIVQDKFGKLWISVSGENNEPGSLVILDPIGDSVIMKLKLSTNNPSHLGFNSGRDTLYYLNKDIYRMALADLTIPKSPCVNADGKTIYGFGVDPNSGDIYVADAIDYSQKGLVYRYTSAGQPITSFKVGYLPNGFIFN